MASGLPGKRRPRGESSRERKTASVKKPRLAKRGDEAATDPHLDAKDSLGDQVRRLQAQLEATNAKLREETHERRQLKRSVTEIAEKERRRIGEDLHDGPCQFLSALVYMARSLEKKLVKAKQPRAALEAAGLAQRIHEAVEQVRNVAKGFHALDVDAQGLRVALRELAVSASGPVRCRFQHRGAIEITDDTIANHLYRIAQEAVANAIRHAKPRDITIDLSQESDTLVLAITNDGGSFPKSAHQADGMGLRLMRYRAEEMGASFAIESLAKKGTRVKCSLPLQTTGIRRVVLKTKERRNHR